ncbi:MAG: Fe-S cluster assembly protein SufB, partial [Acidimicrobiia bacterium]
MAPTGIDRYVFEPRKGLAKGIVKEMSYVRSEPEWMQRFRLRALGFFEHKPMLDWFAKNMPDIDFDDVRHLQPTEPAQDDSEVVCRHRETLERNGVL